MRSGPLRLSLAQGPVPHPDRRAEVALRQVQAGQLGAAVVRDNVWLATDRLTTLGLRGCGSCRDEERFCDLPCHRIGVRDLEVRWS